MQPKAGTTPSSSSAISFAFTQSSRSGGVFELEVVDDRPGLIVFQANGSAARAVFGNEQGGHRWQRVPPTERRGRVHTSTVTVAVLDEPLSNQLVIPINQVEFDAVRGSGAGGQHRNVTCSAIRAKHIPTGIEARCESERSQHQNKASALAVLRARVWEHMQSSANQSRAADRKRQVGSGQRGDKRRTIRQQDGQVHDHVTGQRWRYDAYVNGQW